MTYSCACRHVLTMTRIYKVLMVFDTMMGITKPKSKNNGAGESGVRWIFP